MQYAKTGYKAGRPDTANRPTEGGGHFTTLPIFDTKKSSMKPHPAGRGSFGRLPVRIPNMTTERKPMCDDDLLRLLADQRGRTVSQMATHFQVTLTAIRNRLIRLQDRERVVRRREETSHPSATPQRGRPRYLYYIATRGVTALQDSSEEDVPAN
jgi:hypothetical protein